MTCYDNNINMKKIELTKGKFTLVDNDDFEWLNQYKWYYFRTKDGNEYAANRINNKTTYMHRMILNAQKNEYCDHINGDGLDNRRNNLRKCTNQQNGFNSKISKNNTSGYKGVTWHKQDELWQARIQKNGKDISLGTYRNKLDAARAYDKGAIKYFGEFARLNNIK